MQKYVQKFMDWFERAPFILSFWALPIVAILYVIAFIRNKFRR